MSSEPVHLLDRSKTPPIPSGTTPLQHQVAGHIFGRSNGHQVNKIGCLQTSDGAVLKPALGGNKGLREVDFYQELFSADCQDRVLLDLRHLVPKFLGVWTTPEHPGLVYLKLENITRKFQHPCVMDIKIGPITYDHEADAAKIAREKAKSPSLPEVGFQILGVRLYEPATGIYKTLDRNRVRTLNTTTVLTKGLAMYFRADDSFDVHLVRTFLRHLHTIESWFNAQSLYCFLASSLLFVYDGDAVRLPESVDDLSNGCKAAESNHSVADNVSDSWWEERVQLKMIDFTHAFPVTSPDENYLTGLRSLMGYVTCLKPGMYEPDV